MKIGKLPNSLLNKIVLDPINKYSIDREEVLVKPSIGEDCSALTIGDNICLLSTDPITGAVADIGKLAVHINSNDIAAGGSAACACGCGKNGRKNGWQTKRSAGRRNTENNYRCIYSGKRGKYVRFRWPYRDYRRRC